MGEYMSFWWAKFLVELQISGIVFLLLFLIAMIPVTRKAIKQWRCKHPTYRENYACQAICTHCGKDMGFVGTIRKMKNHKEV
ncbi:membrane protein [Salmonella phage Se-J]|uniref:membrane protein n=1 Tax=Salmonella phage Se-J TaxID=2698910 RepID=UPI0018AF63E3|nr:membrane protein [Salmonella phage Se-J]